MSLPRPVPALADASFRTWIAGVSAGVLIALAYLAHVPAGDSARAWAYAIVSLLGSVGLLSLAPALPLLFACMLPWRRLVALFHGLGWGLLALALFVDTRVYNLFRFHLNATVWELATAPGADEAIHVSARDVATVLAAALAFGAAVAALFLRWSAPSRAATTFATRTVTRRLCIAFVIIAALQAAGSAAFALADSFGDEDVASLWGIVPLQPRMTVRKALDKDLHVELADVAPPRGAGRRLRYPLERVALPADGPRSNVLILVVDSLRRDMLAPETMPWTWALAQEGRRFDDEISGGNGTRFGVFSMLYGLPGGYWYPMMDARRPPVLFDALMEAGYELRAWGSASLGYPELRATAFARIPGAVEDRLDAGQGDDRDGELGRRLSAWLRARTPASPPFVGFAFLDAPHQIYACPKNQQIFEPSEVDVDYLKLSSRARIDDATRLRLFNRYRNAVHYADGIVGEVLDALAASGHGEDTIVVVTGDHGEEFGEHGFWGHTSNFTLEQVAVPLVLRGPGVPVGVVTSPTSHVDLPATLLELCGLPRSLRAVYTTGGSLLDEWPRDRRRLLSGFDRYGAWTPHGILWLPTAGWLGDVEVYDADWHRVARPRDAVREEIGVLREMASQQSRFLR